ncbi:hypothetical protein [Cupriavidus sp. D384]|uniref:hypothetical protein n=1 Tax=Cupriavidus sp. D384 TaxID=1538095 RepID=UPI00083783A5|nr:hypothetical protein [Cupriavidus sp. D384]
MKKLFAAFASAALVGTVFAQTGVPASAAPSQGAATHDKVTATKGKADVSTTHHKSPAKASHHKAGKTGEAAAAKPAAGSPTTDAKADANKTKAGATASVAPTSPAAHPATAKTVTVDKTKTQ